ncbi:DUF1642 domain-containing protein [Enterococcus raffinosus]|uniref:DUF1642 domain-containing protein n=1 Tax=Enterococcus raffinosus TaxID=71452 RepID=UPI001C8C0604|nr:DUF1642 domain-containing protein [Enterococcus raffinosus]MBX9038476.1 DUF1642 domain-containing protein [Enterococcus raffinosus]
MSKSEPRYEVVFLEDEDGDRKVLVEKKVDSYVVGCDIIWESENEGLSNQLFTEQRIKSMDERYWDFAVQVK